MPGRLPDFGVDKTGSYHYSQANFLRKPQGVPQP
jgi:hypothetical protein